MTSPSLEVETDSGEFRGAFPQTLPDPGIESRGRQCHHAGRACRAAVFQRTVVVARTRNGGGEQHRLRPVGGRLNGPGEPADHCDESGRAAIGEDRGVTPTRVGRYREDVDVRLGGGVGFLLGEERRLQIGPELTGAVTVAGDVDKRNVNAELLVDARYRITSDLEAGLGIGPGLSAGIGTPNLRGVLMIAYTPEPKKAPSDRDKDGIIDEKDACPDVPGVASTDPKKHGCPPPSDRDKDGIIDELDACPDVPGVASDDPKKNGCPLPKDRDKDGIIDDLDACPDVKGVADADPKKNGCPPDRDGDGIIDAEDACPDVKGVASKDPKAVEPVFQIGWIYNEQKKFGTASIAFDGTGDYLSIPDSAAFFMDLGEFTIEFFLRASALGSRAGLVQQTNSAGQNTATSFFIELNTSSKISAFVAYGSSNTTEIESSVLSTNTWYHVALVRLGNTLYLYLDGVSQGSSSIGSNSLNNSSEDIRIGQSPFQSTGLNGYMDEIRIVKGVALYAGNFTPPTAPFPDA